MTTRKMIVFKFPDTLWNREYADKARLLQFPPRRQGREQTFALVVLRQSGRTGAPRTVGVMSRRWRSRPISSKIALARAWPLTREASSQMQKSNYR